jgi:hypothetical protein
MSTEQRNFIVGDKAIAARHFTDSMDRRHIAGNLVGVVTFVDQGGSEDVVCIDGAFSVRPASEFLFPGLS